MEESESTALESSNQEEETEARELYANGIFMKTTEVEAMLDEGNIQDAEAAIRERLSINAEEARALLGQLEYLMGNFERALCVFDGVDLHANIQQLQPSLTRKPSKKASSRGSTDSELNVSQHAAGVVLVALYVKTKSLQKLGRFTEAANECKGILDAVESIFQQGIVDAQVDAKLQETVSQAVELLPELRNGSVYHMKPLVLISRRSSTKWNLDNDRCSRIRKSSLSSCFTVVWKLHHLVYLWRLMEHTYPRTILKRVFYYS
ncbi:Protein npg1 [Dionaea muscipula]